MAVTWRTTINAGALREARAYAEPDGGHKDDSEVQALDTREINRKVVEQFRAGGEIEGMHRDRLVLLTTTGAKTGQPRTTPLMFHRDGDRLLVIASNAGAPKDPQWFGNLVRRPRVTVEVGDEKYEALATVLTGPARERQWALLTDSYAFFADHERQAGRTIPVVALTKLPDGE
jgi:deazaflavin-dependent oxidoreductase (nitroreductase family)